MGTTPYQLFLTLDITDNALYVQENNELSACAIHVYPLT